MQHLWDVILWIKDYISDSFASFDNYVIIVVKLCDQISDWVVENPGTSSNGKKEEKNLSSKSARYLNARCPWYASNNLEFLIVQC